MAECAIKVQPPYGQYPGFKHYEDTRTGAPLCWQRESFHDPKLGSPLTGRENLKLYAPDAFPRGFSPYVTLKTVDGRVEGIQVDTSGTYQQTILDALTEKFGRPTHVDRTPRQNLMGATFKSITAHWDFADLDVMFIGLTKVDEGFLLIRSPVIETAENPPQPKL